SPDKVSQLLGNAYPAGSYVAFAESLSDNVADKGVGGIDKTIEDPYYFRDVSDDQQDSPEWYWASCYTAIAASNQALEACDQAADQAAYSSQRGEALITRAYAHFMLVTFFSKVYDPATADVDEGIPYVTEPEKVVFKKYDRKTVAYVYDMIEKDLLAGLPLLDDKRYSVPKYHFTKIAANAFAARFYLFKRDYQKVVDYANQVFSSGNVTALLRPWNTTYLTYTPQDMFTIYAKATEPANLLLAETSSLWARNYYTNRYGFNSAKRDEILGDNVTGGDWAFKNQLYTAGTENYLIPKINEYFVRSSVNATIGTPYVMVPLFTAEEVLFNRIEANVFLNNTTSALTDLNTYVSTRIINYNSSTDNITTDKMKNFYGTANVQAGEFFTLVDFKRAEFVQEGMRWFDILRFSLTVTHYTANGQVYQLTGNDLRRVLQIPASAKVAGIDQNPR
ncbi:MAG: RagB/SusD family nutrient uptake outer membrane protein, partial [Bacteroidota bacterium]